MAENTQTQTAEVVADEPQAEVQPTRLQVFVNKHPRAAKVLAVVGVTGTAIGGVMVAKTVQANRKHVDQAVDHAQEAVAELSTAVTPQEPTEA